MRNYLAELERGAYIREDLPPEAVGYRSLAADYSPEEEIELFRRPDLPARQDEPPAEGGAEGSGRSRLRGQSSPLLHSSPLAPPTTSSRAEGQSVGTKRSRVPGVFSP